MIKYIFLGIVQGLTEFLPVSSSGHLVILEHLFGITENQLAITVILHLGTGVALLIFFFRDLLELLQNFRLLLLLLTATAITALIGYSGKDFFESLFASPKPVAAALLITGAVLSITRNFLNGKRNNLKMKDAVIFGLTQSIAIIPGISRSGMTISTLLFRNISRQESFRFSFLAAIPVIFGAAILEAGKINFAIGLNRGNLAVGFLFSLISGLIALSLLKRILERAKFHYFGYYCIFIAVIALLFIK